MTNYDRLLSEAKSEVTKSFCHLQTRNNAGTIEDLGQKIDALNIAWDAVTDALVRQRDERDRLIAHLLAELAEARKR